MSELISNEEAKPASRSQREVKNFFLFIKEKYARKNKLDEATLLSEEALAKDWLKEAEEKAWAKFQ